jgi:hypothetical protein
MGTKPWGVAPHKLAIAPCVHLAPTDSQLEVPHLWCHLPQHEAAGLTAATGIAVLGEAAGGLVLSGHHAHLAHGVGVAHGRQKLVPSAGGEVLLQDVVRRRGLLWRSSHRQKRKKNYTLVRNSKISMFYRTLVTSLD